MKWLSQLFYLMLKIKKFDSFFYIARFQDNQDYVEGKKKKNQTTNSEAEQTKRHKFDNCTKLEKVSPYKGNSKAGDLAQW